jgi:hypothetical protein
MMKITTLCRQHGQYTGGMNIFVKATAPPALRTERIQSIAWLYAGVLSVMAVGQLFGFEKFIPLIENYQLPGGVGTATLVAGVIVTAEVFALPFLLRLRLSPAMCAVSMAAGIVSATIWLKLALWANIADTAVQNIGFLGNKVTVPVGWWAVLFAAALVTLAVWAVWGMWPGSRTIHTNTKK